MVYAAKTTRPTKAQAVMLSLLDDYAKAHGVHYTVVDSIGDRGANGVYTTAEGMVVALDAEEGYLTRVATHEGVALHPGADGAGGPGLAGCGADAIAEHGRIRPGDPGGGEAGAVQGRRRPGS